MRINRITNALHPPSPRLIAVALCMLLAAGCNVGPRYSKPAVETPSAFKELTPDEMSETAGWKTAQPADTLPRGKWWEIFNDPDLNALEDQVAVSNQTVAASFAAFLSARAVVKQARSAYYPTVTTTPSLTRQKQVNRQFSGESNTNTVGPAIGTGASHPITFYSLPFDATWELDLWGNIRNTVKAQTLEAQAAAADLENVRLTMQAELAVDYYQLRAEDAQKQLLDDTVKAYKDSLDLVNARFHTGIASDEDVSQAETQYTTALAEDTDLGILRAQYEHAIAVLIGRAPSSFSVDPKPLVPNPVAIPLAVPSVLLERRPDVAAAERRAAEANAQIGVAKSAYYPTLTLGASANSEATRLDDLVSWPNFAWSVGGSLAETLFDGGKRAGATAQARAAYSQNVASYRLAVLTAFQQVEDDLAALRVLSRELQQQDDAVKAAQRFLNLSRERYRLGIDSYLNVITAQTALLGNQRTLVSLQLEQMTSSVQLIEALGGGWDASQMPTPRQLSSRSSLNE
jgi:NodT family efflux transporter outer membrane factor (OMF) lipoprotein